MATLLLVGGVGIFIYWLYAKESVRQQMARSEQLWKQDSSVYKPRDILSPDGNTIIGSELVNNKGGTIGNHD